MKHIHKYIYACEYIFDDIFKRPIKMYKISIFNLYYKKYCKILFKYILKAF